MHKSFYDLVSRGGDTSGVNQCWGTYESSTNTGWGPGFQNACIHSGFTNTGGDVATVWYSYPLASAGTIIDENTTASNPANNTNPTTESICPKGWTLPRRSQIETLTSGGGTTYLSVFSPVLGGHYYNGALYNEATHGYYLGSEAYNGARRYILSYKENKLSTGNGSRRNGEYIRCVAKQKTITDLAYMQDVVAGL